MAIRERRESGKWGRTMTVGCFATNLFMNGPLFFLLVSCASTTTSFGAIVFRVEAELLPVGIVFAFLSPRFAAM